MQKSSRGATFTMLALFFTNPTLTDSGQAIFLLPGYFLGGAPRLPGAPPLLAPALLPITGSQEAPGLSLKFPAPRSSQLGIKTTALTPYLWQPQCQGHC